MLISVSPEGDVLVPGTAEFFERIGYSNPDFDASDYVVRNMGFVSIERLDEIRMAVRLRPALVKPSALDAALRFMANQRCEQIEIEYFDEGWTTERWPNDPAYLHRMVELCDASEERGEEPRYAASPLSLARLTDDFANPLKPLFQKWRVSTSVFDDTTLPFLINYCLDYRLSVMASSPGEPLRFEFLGEGFKFFGDRERLDAMGSRIDQQPDRTYGEWLADHYRRVVDSNAPTHDYVTAIIQTSSGPPRRSRYERLLLPWRTPNGRTIVTCASVLINTEIQPQSASAGDLGAADERVTTLSALSDEPFYIRQKLRRAHPH